MTTSATSTEKATEISTTSGIPFAPVAAKMRLFSSDMKPTTIDTALRRTTIMSMPSSTTERAKAVILLREDVCVNRDAEHHVLREGDQRKAAEASSARTPTMLSTSVLNAELSDDAMNRQRDDDGLEGEGDESGDIDAIGVLDVGLPGDGERQHYGPQCQTVEKRIEAVLIKQHRKLDQHQGRSARRSAPC